MRQRTHGGRMTTIPVVFLLVVALSIGIMLLPTAASAATSSTPTAATYVTNGSVEAILPSGGIIYIGGNFTQVGPVGGPMSTRNYIAAINEATGAVTAWNPGADSTVY